MRPLSLVLFFVLMVLAASPAAAQRFPFEKLVPVSPETTLDVVTISGKVDITVGDAGRVQILGTVTVKIGLNVPADAPAVARRIAANPPVDTNAGLLRLREPSDPTERRAVEVSYQVRVPRTMAVRVTSDSGATTVDGVTGAVNVKTQSSAITLSRLGGAVDITTGSGAVRVDGVDGPLRIATSSSEIRVSGARGSFHARTQSGAVRAAFDGPGDADVETSSSEITLEDLSGAANVRTQSGRVIMSGSPGRAWTVSTGSSAISASIRRQPAVTLDLSSGSGSVRVEGLSVQGNVSKGRVSGTVGGGGPEIRLSSRSGSIHVTGP